MTKTAKKRSDLMKTAFFFSFLLATVVLVASSAFAGSSIGERMKERLPKVLIAKNAGTVGEGSSGLLHLRAADADEAVVSLVKAENSDRKAYFSLVAKKNEVSSSAVAKQWAKAMRSKGKEGHWFRDKDGNWSQK